LSAQAIVNKGNIAWRNKFLRFLGEAITNLSGHEVQVACPVVRDRRRGTGTLADGSAAAIVVSVDGRGNEVHCMVAWG
jgi:acyl-coenzyme A thioesterase PaaI-like protein